MQSDQADDLLASLTNKQREVLDLLIEHKTSKEISRRLGISPHTVDQRIMLSRAKLGVATRAGVAQEYRRLLSGSSGETSIYERSVYASSGLAPVPETTQVDQQEDAVRRQQSLSSRNETLPSAAVYSGEALTGSYHRVLPEMFDGPYGTYIRLGTIGAFAMFLILIVMGGIAMFAQLSQIVDR